MRDIEVRLKSNQRQKLVAALKLAHAVVIIDHHVSEACIQKEILLQCPDIVNLSVNDGLTSSVPS